MNSNVVLVVVAHSDDETIGMGEQLKEKIVGEVIVINNGGSKMVLIKMKLKIE